MWTGPIVIRLLIDHFTDHPGIGTKPDWIVAWPPELQSWPIDGHLLVHCRAKAGGRSIRAICSDLGWSKSAHYRIVKREAQLLADSLD